MQFLFIGEQRSKTALARNWTWESGRLAGKTLQEALMPLGLRYGEHYRCRNILDDSGVFSTKTIQHLRDYVREGVQLVSMCVTADQTLRAYELPHVRIIHPAARGSIRKRELYQAHVAEVLGPIIAARQWSR